MSSAQVGTGRATAAGERLRLFVALELPREVREALVAWGVRALANDGPGGRNALRVLDPQTLHVTLCFLGSHALDRVDAIARECARLADAPAAALSLGDPTWLPHRRPRVLAVALDEADGALSTMQAMLSQALAGGGWYEPEARPFFAHVTVARVRKRERIAPIGLERPPALAFTGETLTLFRSRTSHGGARYEALRSVRLAPGSAL